MSTLPQRALLLVESLPDSREKQYLLKRLSRVKRPGPPKVRTQKDAWKTLRDKLDRAFSIYIRLRDADNQGICKCITCGTPKFWKEMDCGHYISRRFIPTRWHEKNCHAQCRVCNRFSEGKHGIYHNEINQKYGDGTASGLSALSSHPARATKEKAPYLLKHYTDQVEKLSYKNPPENPV